jgi:hypothetical protein
MPAQYAHLDGRRYVNEDFVSAVREAFPATNKKIPLGYSVYTGWTGKDEVLFVEQGDTNPDVDFSGPVYQVSFDPSHPECFEKSILGDIKHTKIDRTASVQGSRQRLARGDEDDLGLRWGSTLSECMARRAAIEVTARRGNGLYGYPKMVQAACETAARRLNTRAASLVRQAMRRDDAVVGFLNTHAKRADSLPAKVLLAAFRDSLPKIEAEALRLDEPPPPPTPTVVLASMKEAGSRWGAYGYPAKTAKLGLGACTALRQAAGELAGAMHSRRANMHPRFTGFFGEHGKTAHCGASRLILLSYPDVGFCRSAAEGTDEWLAWDPVTG